MANWAALSNAIRQVIYSNGTRDITGQILQTALLNIVNNIGSLPAFGGIATPSTNPGVHDGPVFYIATTTGTYSNFNNITITKAEVPSVLIYTNNTWTKQVIGSALAADIEAIVTSLSTEASARQQADASLQSAIAAEATRAAGKEQELESGVSGALDALDNKLNKQEVYQDGLVVVDENGKIGAQIGSKQIWQGMPYNRLYGWGQHPYGQGELPPYSRVAGILEADMLSVRGGKGRWNGTDTGNFDHGGHVFEGWNEEMDVRLTAGIGLHNKNVAWLQTFHPATQEGTDGGSYYGVTQLGSDIDGQGLMAMPTLLVAGAMLALKLGGTKPPQINDSQFQVITEAGLLQSHMYNATDKVPYGAMYFAGDKDECIRVYTHHGWHSIQFATDFYVDYKANGTNTTCSNTGANAAHYKTNWTGTISGDTLPANIEVTISGVPVAFTYSNGTITVQGNKITGCIYIKALTE